jgi:putative PIN family toxin of toxin-antitoxin system
MRLVVDTNVLVSAALKETSWPAGTVRWLGKYDGLLKSAATEKEAFAVLQRPRLAPKITPPFLDGLRRLFAAAELVQIAERVTACRDPKDDKFLELAVNGHADVIVSGDADLLVLDTFRGIPIVPPAAFVQAGHKRSTA